MLSLHLPSLLTVIGLIPNISHSDQLLADTFAYHVVSNELSPDNVSDVTIGLTYLNDPHLVALEGGKSQVLAWSKLSFDCRVHILNQKCVFSSPYRIKLKLMTGKQHGSPHRRHDTLQQHRDQHRQRRHRRPRLLPRRRRRQQT
jgi:hypothetical protein